MRRRGCLAPIILAVILFGIAHIIFQERPVSTTRGARVSTDYRASYSSVTAMPRYTPEPTKSIAQKYYETIVSAISSAASATSTPQSQSTAAPTPRPTPAPTVRPTATPSPYTRAPQATAASTPAPGAKYVLNKNTKKFHKPNCTDVKKIKDSNRIDFTGTRQEAINQGYVPCKHCNP